VAAVVALATSLGLSATPTHGQTVLVHVLAAESAEPLVGAVAHLVLPSGEVHGSRLTDRSGRALFANVDAGSYSVRAEMIGRATGQSDAFRVAEEGSVPLVLRLESRAIPLTGVEVTADAGPCRTRPREEGRLLAAVWEEARKALSAAAVTDEQGSYRYVLVTYERELDAERAILDEERTRKEGYMRTPFESRPAEDLTRNGFVRKGSAEWTYYAPDAHVLLSDDFIDNHCFRLVEGGPAEQGLVGLAFEPTGESEAISDIAGTLWLDRETVELRWLDFSYEHLEPEVRSGEAVGRVEFQRMPEGAWIVPEWWIRMPLVEVVRASGLEQSRRITGFLQTGGTVLEILEAGGRDLGRGVRTGAIEGIVVDSLGVPMPEVRVGVVGSNQMVFTNAEGRFDIVGLDPGTYAVRLVVARLEELGLVPPTMNRQVLGGESSYLEYHVLSAREIAAARCGPEEVPEGTSVLTGVVRDAAGGGPVAAATLRLTWSRYDDSASTVVSFREEISGFETAADERGVYTFCGVPRREELTLVTLVAGEEVAEQSLALSAQEESRVHVVRVAR
jgi:hypothetical protein